MFVACRSGTCYAVIMNCAGVSSGNDEGAMLLPPLAAQFSTASVHAFHESLWTTPCSSFGNKHLARRAEILRMFAMFDAK